LEKYHEGLEAFKKAGDEASAHYNLGCVYMQAGKYKEAVESFEKAIQIKPVFYVKAYENLRKAKDAVKGSYRQ
jgi:tetratricopeptide (TPR) repeat protein